MILIRQIKNYKPANLLLIIVIGILLWLRTFLSKGTLGIYLDSNPMPIYNWIYSGLASPKFALLCKFLAFLLVILQAAILNVIANRSNLLGFRSYLPGLFFILISSSFPEYQILHPILFANLFFLIAWERISDIIEKSNTVSAFYNSGFFIGIATLFYPNYVYFLSIVALSTALNRISTAREFVMIIVGFITVWYFYLATNYIFFTRIEFSGLEADITFTTTKFFELKSGQIIFLLYIGFLLFLASIQLGAYMSNVKIQIRRNLKFLFSWFLAGIFIFLFTKSSYETIYILAVPISMLFSIYFLNIKNKWIAEIVWFLLIIVSTVNQIFPDIF